MMSGLQINNVVSLNEGGDNGQVDIKPEPVDVGYDAAFTSGPSAAVPDPVPGLDLSNGSKNATDITFPTIGDSSNRLRGILSNMLSDTSKELSVKTIIEDLLQKNEYLLAQNNAGLYKPQPRNMSYKKYDEASTKNDSQSSGSASVYNINNATSTTTVSMPKAGESALLRPGSPTRTCTPPKVDSVTLCLSEMAVLDTKTEQTFSDIKAEPVCGVASKAFIMTQLGVNIQTDLHFYWCNFCPFKTDSKQNLLSHVMDHRFHCKTCAYQSFSRADVIRHAVKEHSDFYETAKTLKFCSFLPIVKQYAGSTGGRTTKRKVDVEKTAVEKKKKLDNGSESKSDNEKSENEKESSETEEPKEETKKSQKKDDDYEFFEMEVDEVDDDNNNYGEDEVDDDDDDNDAGTETIITPSVKPKKVESPRSLPISVPNLLRKSPMKLKQILPASNISATLTTKTSTASPQMAKAGNTVTVSSGLCWNCGYCDFVTLSQTFLKTHLNSQHTGKAHKYVAMLVSSQEEMNRIKEKDSTLYQNPNTMLYSSQVAQQTTFVTVTPPTLPVVTSSVSTAAPINTNTPTTSATDMTSGSDKDMNMDYDDSESDEDFIPADQKKKYPLTYKCAHCNFNAPVCFKIKEHLQIKHIGCVLYSLDMRAVKLKQRRYVFFCHRKNCSFTTKKTDEYLNHSESCTPWLEPGCPEKIDTATKKCLELTRSFSSKISQKAFQMAKNFKSSRSAEYACVHCSYTSNNNTRVKKHVLSNHRDGDTLMKDLQAHRMKKKMYVYFCKHCLWETRNDGELSDHLKEKHNDSSVVNPAPAFPDEEPPLASTATMVMEMPSMSSPVVASPTVSMEVAESPPTTTPDESANNSESGEYDDNFDDLEVPQDVIQSLMDEYVTHEASHGVSPGRPTRNAAAKAQVRCRAQGQTPQLFRCMHCSHMCFGVNLAKKHLKNRHSAEPLRSIDLKKKIARTYAYYCFCPKEGCTFLNTSEESVTNHACSDHGYSLDHEELQRLNMPLIRSGQVRHDMQYECLYCTAGSPNVKNNMEKMRRHILEDHGGEEVIFRDCIARKLRKTSRVFMCPHLTCGYNTTDQKEYTLHHLAHEKSHIYECAKCQWFTANTDTVASHMSAVHPGDQVTTMEIYLDLDDKGNVVKKVGGTVIKQEPE